MFEPSSHSYNHNGSSTTTLDPMEKLKMDKERRAKERYKLEYEAKKREFDMHSANKARYELEKKRYEMELAKYKIDTLSTLRDEKKYDIEKMHLTDEEVVILKKIQMMEVELQQLKNKAQKLKQEKEQSTRKDRELLSDITKKNAYISSLNLKLQATVRNLVEAERRVTTLNAELTTLKKYA